MSLKWLKFAWHNTLRNPRRSAVTVGIAALGTAAILEATRSLAARPSPNYSLMVIITDGEDHEGGALEAAQEARKRGINVFILGVGDPKGAPIPDGQGGYMTDATGQTVMSKLNEQMCQDIAKAGSGTYIHVDNTSEAQEQLNDQLARLQKGETSSLIYSEYDEQFQAFGLIAILLMIIEICILESKNPRLRNVRLFKKRQPPA